MSILSQVPAPKAYRTIFLSDIHLGSRGCQADLLLDFLQNHRAKRIYLVGDIIDVWQLKRGWYWPPEHNQVIQVVLERANQGAEVVFIPGNHDEGARKYLGTHFGGIEVKSRDTVYLADGRKFLVTHGDQFDNVVVNAKWLAHVGDRAYAVMLRLNTWINRIRWIWRGQYWSLSNWAKQQVKRAVNYISEYERVLAEEAQRGGFDGVICGHIHKAEISRIRDVDYVNTGDWVESCTAIVEDDVGALHLIDWAAETRRRGLIREATRRRRKRAKPDKVA